VVAVVDQPEVLVAVLEQRRGRVEGQLRERQDLAGELLAHLRQVVGVDVTVAAHPDEVARRQADLLGDHPGEQRVAGDVERHAEEQVGAALVELAGEPAVGDVELEQRVAGRERHLRQRRHVPRGDQHAAGVGIRAQRLQDLGELVDRAAVRGRPRAPLHPVDGAELTVPVGPLVPDAHPVLLQPPDVALAAEEPQQLAEDRAGVHPLGGHQREALAQVEPHLVAEHAQGAGAGAVGLRGAGLQHPPQQVLVLGVDGGRRRRRAEVGLGHGHPSAT
jgi:hypothetical protein